MAKNNREAGMRRERQVKDKLTFEGWEVQKARMSFGSADLLAENHYDGRRMLIQVKATKGNPYNSFGPAERARLLKDAQIAGGEAWLCHWPPHGKENWIHSKDWP
jgi:Holliday junction resolvase